MENHEAATNIARILQGHCDLSGFIATAIAVETVCRFTGWNPSDADYADINEAMSKPVCAWCYPGSKGNSFGSHGICPQHAAEMIALARADNAEVAEARQEQRTLLSDLD